MRKSLSSAACAAALLLSGVSLVAIAPPAVAQASFRLGFDFFHNRLVGEGRWFRHPIWGDVWRPRPSLVGPDFQPYTNGYWEYTDDFGWYWVSNDPFNDVVYHYGRWVYDPRLQWIWIPGYTWAPAWVVWREGDDYTGWMPMPPDEEFISGTGPGFGVNLGPIGLSFYNSWYGGRVDPDRFFVFVDNRHLVERDYRRFRVPRDRVKVIINRTRPIAKFEVVNNRVVNRGVDVRVVERATGRRIAPVPAKSVIKPGAVITTVDEGKQVRVRERAAHPIDVQAVRRGGGGKNDTAMPGGAMGATPAEPQPGNATPAEGTGRGNRNRDNANAPAATTPESTPADTTDGARKRGNRDNTNAPAATTPESTPAETTDGARKRGNRGNGATGDTTGSGMSPGEAGTSPAPAQDTTPPRKHGPRALQGDADQTGDAAQSGNAPAGSRAGRGAGPSAPADTPAAAPRRRGAGANGGDASGMAGPPSGSAAPAPGAEPGDAAAPKKKRKSRPDEQPGGSPQ